MAELVDPKIVWALKLAFDREWYEAMADSARAGFIEMSLYPPNLLCVLADALATARADGLLHERALDDIADKIETVLVNCGYKPPDPTTTTEEQQWNEPN